MTIRLLIASAAVLTIYGAAHWVRDRGMPSKPAPLEMKISELPTTLGDWKGETTALDPQTFNAIGATMTIDRIYRNGHSQTISLHSAVFDRLYGAQGLWHPPEVCYSTHGWQIGDGKLLSLDQAGATGDTARLISVERRGATDYVLYWYQIEGQAFCDGDRQRQIFLGCRGRSVCPPVVKVMLFASAPNAEEAEKTLLGFAGSVFAWTRQFH
jgi:hypothetical protein